MPTAEEIAGYADRLLRTDEVEDYPNALNGLQIGCHRQIERIAAAVDFSMRTIGEAAAGGANLLIVHHGMFWNGLERLVGVSYERIRMLVGHDIAVYSSHLPLDRHEKIGNNILLARQLGLKPSAPFARHGSVFVGVSGEADIETATISDRAREFAAGCGGSIRTTPVAAGRRTRRWGMCTGAGASADTLREAAAMRLDTLIVGEGPHWTAVSAEEQGLTIIYAGHYATETLGIRALAQDLSEKFDLPWSFIDAPTGL